MRSILLLVLASFAAANAVSDKKIICYFGSWSVYRPGLGKFEIEDIEPNLCTHVIYTFVGLDDDTFGIKIIDPWQDLPDDGGHDGFARFVNFRKSYPNVKFLVAIGGWNEGSAKYSDMASDPITRRVFVKSALEFVKRYKFDGLDLDWEYPNQRGGEPEDVDNFSALLRELRTEFKRANLLLTAALGGPRSSASKSYNVQEISAHLDFMHLLTYDFHGSWNNYTGINSPLYNGHTDIGNDQEWTVDASIRYWLSQGAPREKLVIGIPFYGRSFTLLSRNMNNVGDEATGPGTAGPYTRQEGVLGYNEICSKQNKFPWTIKFDEERRVPYSYRGHQWVGYDDIRSVKEKAEYVKSMKLGGVMVWSVDTDDFRGTCGEKYPLLRTIHRTLNN